MMLNSFAKGCVGLPESYERSRGGPSHLVDTLSLTVPSLSLNHLRHKPQEKPSPSYVGVRQVIDSLTIDTIIVRKIYRRC